MHTRTNHRYSSLTKPQDTRRIPSISTLYTHTKTPTRTAKVAQATATATNRRPNQLEKHQEQPPPSLQQEAIPLHTLAPCLVITHTSHLMHLIHKHSLCRASTEAANSCSQRKIHQIASQTKIVLTAEKTATTITLNRVQLKNHLAKRRMERKHWIHLPRLNQNILILIYNCEINRIQQVHNPMLILL